MAKRFEMTTGEALIWATQIRQTVKNTEDLAHQFEVCPEHMARLKEINDRELARADWLDRLALETIEMADEVHG